uniref:Secreted protein n=1 Tax=Steinernema glaseri TaxID=37863 RepID=A0A1I8AK41_9BILA
MAQLAPICVHRRGTTTASEARTAQRHSNELNCRIQQTLVQQTLGFSTVNGDDDRCKRTDERCHSQEARARSN